MANSLALFGQIGSSVAAIALAAGLFGISSGTAQASIVTNTPLGSPGYYNGTGNPNEGYTVDTEGNTEIGLGVLYRKSGPEVHPTPSTGSTYFVNTGYYNYSADSCYGVCAAWNVQYSLNLGSSETLSNYITWLTVENLSTFATSAFDPLTTFHDNAGWDGSRHYQNTEPAAFAAGYGFQNSENLTYSEFASLGFNPLEMASYLVTFSVYAASDTGRTNALASVSETINAVPLPAALPLVVSGLGGMGLLGWRRKRKTAAPMMA